MLTIPDSTTLEEQVLAYFTTNFAGRDVTTGSYLGQRARALSEALLGIYQSIRDAETGCIPSTSTASDRLGEFAVLFGLPDGSGIAGRYGRKLATIATGGGGAWTYSGAGPFVYTLSAGQILYAPDGVTKFQTTANVTWAAAGTGTGNGSISSITKGTAANLSIGTVLSVSSPPSGINNSLTLTVATSGAIDSESDEALLARILDRLQNPISGGTAANWRAWALGVSGVSGAYVYPHRNGNGTVDDVVVQSGSGQSRRVTTASVLTAVETAVDAARVVSMGGRRVQTTYMPNGSGLNVIIQAVPTTGNSFDWDSTAATTRTIASHVNGVSLTASGALPADFIAAVDAYIAAPSTTPAPRIQYKSSASALPVQVRISAYNAGTFVCTYLSAPSVEPTNGDTIYAGGPVVDQVAADVLAYVDALGPSKASGYADSGADWDDTVRIDDLIRVAMTSENATTGDRLVRDLATIPTINGGTANVQAPDVTPAQGPGMSYLLSVIVKP